MGDTPSDPLTGDRPPPLRPVWESDLTRFDRPVVDWVGAARSAAVMAIPLAVAATTDYVVSGVFAAIGCLNILLLQFLGTARARLVRSLWGLGLNSVAIAIGTWVGSLGWFEIPLVAVGLIVIHLTNRIPRPGSLPLTVSALFVIGVGLPGGSPADAVSRAALVLIGGLLGVAGLALHIGLLRLRTPVGTGTVAGEPASPAPSSSVRVLPEWVHATAVGLTAAGGLAISLWAGLSRDYWIMLTAVVVLRTRFEETLSVGVSRMGGTVLGAAVGAIVTIGVISPELQGALAFLFTFGVFAFGRANYALYTLSLTAFVIVLLNLTYPSGVVLAETRILDTFIGGALALLVATLLWYLRYRPSAARPGASAGGAYAPAWVEAGVSPDARDPPGLTAGEQLRNSWPAEMVSPLRPRGEAGRLFLTSARCLFFRKGGLFGRRRVEDTAAFQVRLEEIRSVSSRPSWMAIGYGDRVSVPGIELNSVEFRLDRETPSEPVVAAIVSAQRDRGGSSLKIPP